MTVPIYSAYGLTFDSPIPLPELIASDSDDADITIRKGAIDREAPETDQHGFYGKVDGQSAFLYWESAGSFLVKAGKNIVVDPRDDADERLVRLPLLGPVMSVLLQQRGLLTLHASAVAIDGHAVAFLGPKGYGKSTTASALHRRGHPVVTDDVLAVDLSEPRQVLAPAAFPQFKLWPQAAQAAFGESARSFPVLHERVGKQSCRADRGFSQESLPLRRLYLLDVGTALSTEPVKGQDAFLALVRNTYDRRFQLSSETSARHLQQCSQLARRVDLLRLIRKPSLDELDALARFIEDDVSANCLGTASTLAT